ncbi:MAG: N-acetylneuraminate synthase family protein [Treponema sp.]|nr:N-acetylneuraminate synthase family protein [Treponema sp.]
MEKALVIAEIGTSHGGSLEKAYALIDEAADSGADIIKFQWVYADEILHPETGFVELPGGKIRLYDRFKELEVPKEFFASCLEYTHKKGLLFACSPFGLKSLEELVAISPDAIKIASPEVNHIPLLKACAKYYGKIPLILSSGVSKLGDIEKAVDILTSECEKIGSAENGAQSASEINVQGKNLPPLTLLHCITSYPAPENEYNVRAVETLSRIFGLPTGISDHSLDPVLVPVLTVSMGGRMIEKHITLSKKTDGLDDPVALEGEQFAQMCNAVNQSCAVLERYRKDAEATFASSPALDKMEYGKQEIIRQMENQYGKEKVLAVLGSGIKRLAKSERANYGRTNRSLHYLRAMKKGERVTADDVAVLRTEKILTPGIQPDLLESILGGILKRDVTSGSGVLLEDFI